jgi:hypothetical protein
MAEIGIADNGGSKLDSGILLIPIILILIILILIILILIISSSCPLYYF